MDYLLKAMDEAREIRVVIARTTALVEELARRHGMSATARAASGRLVTGALLLASDLKAGNGVTLHVNGGGPVGDMVAVAEPEGTARMFVENPRSDLPSRQPGKLDVGGLVGRGGELRVIKDLGMKQPFVGSVPLQTGEIGDDLAYYLLASEQVPSLVALGVLVDTDLTVLSAGGILIQALPGVEDEKLEQLEKNVQALGAISSLLKEHEQLEDLLSMILGDFGYVVLEHVPLRFACRCSLSKIEGIIRGLPEEDVKSSLAELGHVEVRCNFCNETYTFDEEETNRLRDRPAPDTQISPS